MSGRWRTWDKEEVGETPKQYIIRVRLENAAHFLILKPDATILCIALDCGYNSLESFSRAFKQYYSKSPDSFRKMDEEDQLEILKKKTQDKNKSIDYSSFIYKAQHKSEQGDLSIEVKKLPSRNLIFIPTTLESNTQIVQSFNTIKKWAEVRELIPNDRDIFGLFMGFPIFTALDKCRYLTCIEVDKKTKLSGDVYYMELPARTYVTVKQ